MKKFSFTLIFLCTFSLAFAQKYEYDAVPEVGDWFTTGEYVFEFLEPVVPSDLQQIKKNYDASIKKNSGWYKRHLFENSEAKILPYHKNFGISEEEYNRLMGEYAKLPLHVTRTDTLRVYKTDDSVTFEGKGYAVALNFLKVDVKNTSIYYNQQKVNFVKGKTEDMVVTNIPWTGYHWRSESGAIKDVRIGKIAEYSATDIQLGLTEKEKKIFFHLERTEISASETRFNLAMSANIRKI